MSIGERLKEIRKFLDKDIKTFSSELSISYQTLTHYESDYRGVSDDVKQILVKKYGININWLLTGEGSMHIKGADKKSLVVKTDQLNVEVIDDNEELVEIPLLDIKASAGYGIDGEDYPNKTNMLILRKALLGRYAKYNVQAMKVFGDSMQPEYRDGDIVLCALGVIESNGFYIINIKGQILLKILQFFEDKIKIKSLNPIYDDEIINNNANEHFQIIGKAFKHLKDM